MPTKTAPTAVPSFWWFQGFLVLLVLLPLPFGSNRPWASDLFAIFTSLLGLGLAWDLYFKPTLWPEGAPNKKLKLSLACVSLVAIWAFLQTQSWMPAAWHNNFWQNVKGFAPSDQSSISLDPDSFPESLGRLLSYIIFFLIAFTAGRDGARAKRILKIFAGASVAYALYGLLMQAMGVEMILWFNKWAYLHNVTSTFVNKNSYATFAALGLQTCLVLFWQRLKHGPSVDLSKETKIEAWVKKIGTRDIYYLLMALVMLAALLLSGSRAGIASGLIGCCALLLALAINRKWRVMKGISIALFALALLLGISSLTRIQAIDRLADTSDDFALRLSSYQVSVNTIEDRPFLGHGLGAFEKAFQMHRTPDFTYWFAHAHNDYLETIIELGLPAALLLFTAIFLQTLACVQGIRTRKRQEIFSILGFSATVTISLHALVDFSLQIPAVAATYAVLLALGVAQSWSTRKASELG